MNAVDRIDLLKKELKIGLNRCYTYPNASTDNVVIASILTDIISDLSDIELEIYKGNVK